MPEILVGIDLLPIWLGGLSGREYGRRKEARTESVRKRADIPSPCAGDHRLRDLHARSRWDRDQLERWRRADQGLQGQGNRRKALFHFLSAGRPESGPSRARARNRPEGKAFFGGRLARPKGW